MDFKSHETSRRTASDSLSENAESASFVMFEVQSMMI